MSIVEEVIVALVGNSCSNLFLISYSSVSGYVTSSLLLLEGLFRQYCWPACHLLRTRRSFHRRNSDHPAVHIHISVRTVRGSRSAHWIDYVLVRYQTIISL